MDKQLDVINPYILNFMNEIHFEYDDEVGEYCAWFIWIDWYFWQWETKNTAFLELLEAYLDTKDF